jgi:hypothetical protein
MKDKEQRSETENIGWETRNRVHGTGDRRHRTLVKEGEKGIEERVTGGKHGPIRIKTQKRLFLTKCAPK